MIVLRCDSPGCKSETPHDDIGADWLYMSLAQAGDPMQLGEKQLVSCSPDCAIEAIREHAPKVADGSAFPDPMIDPDDLGDGPLD